jgi:DNA-binding FadR family transcriptional regulator
MESRAKLLVTTRLGPWGERRIAGTTPLRGILGDVTDALGRRIVSGEWRVGEALPTEAEMAAAFKVSRSVIREAVRILSAKGLVRSRQMQGITVLPRSDWRLLDPDLIHWRMHAADRSVLLKDLLQVRLALEPGVVWVATATATDEARAKIEEAYAARLAVRRDAATPREQRELFIAADLAFHRAFLVAVGSEILEQLFAVIEAALALMFDAQLAATGSAEELGDVEHTDRLHAEVYEAFAARDPDRAERAMRVLIQRAMVDAKKGFALAD